MESHTRRIAEFASALKLSDVPPQVVARAKGIVLDGLGCGLYGSDVPWTRIMRSVIGRLEPDGGTASIWGHGQTASPANAALINGTMIQGYELDDAHINGHLHGCAAVLPAVIAAAELVGTAQVSGKRLLTGILAGFEIGPRVGQSMRGENMLLNGWHSGGIVSPFPAAIAAGVILGLDSGQMFHALGVAGTQACGLMAAQYGSMVKRMHHAKGAQSGLYAALLARDGFTGIEDVFEQPYGGYCSTFSHGIDNADLAALSAGLGSSWETMNVIIKGYAAKMGNHSPIDAVGELMTHNGFKAQDVDAVTVAYTEQNVLGCGWWPYEPKGLTAAQLNTGFCIATRLVEGDVFVEQMIEDNIARPDLVELANRVRCVRSVERERRGNDYRLGADVEVKLKDGRVLKNTVDFPPGSVQRPLSTEQMTAKFRKLARKAIDGAQIAKIEELVWNLDGLADTGPLIAALRKK